MPQVRLLRDVTVDAHQTLPVLESKFTRSDVCHLQHEALCAELVGIKEGINEIKRDMPRGK